LLDDERFFAPSGPTSPVVAGGGRSGPCVLSLSLLFNPWVGDDPLVDHGNSPWLMIFLSREEHQ
jgi:hypothetical protein